MRVKESPINIRADSVQNFEVPCEERDIGRVWADVRIPVKDVRTKCICGVHSRPVKQADCGVLRVQPYTRNGAFIMVIGFYDRWGYSILLWRRALTNIVPRPHIWNFSLNRGSFLITSAKRNELISWYNWVCASAEKIFLRNEVVGIYFTASITGFKFKALCRHRIVRLWTFFDHSAVIASQCASIY